MIELMALTNAICLGFIAGLWDREIQRGPSRGWNKDLNANLKTGLGTDASNLDSEETSVVSETPRPTRSSADTPGSGQKQVEFGRKGK